MYRWKRHPKDIMRSLSHELSTPCSELQGRLLEVVMQYRSWAMHKKIRIYEKWSEKHIPKVI